MWRGVQSVEALKRLGKIKEVSSMIAKELDDAKVPKNSWEKLYYFIQEQKYVDAQLDDQEVEPIIVEVKNSTEELGKWEQIQSLEELKKLGSFKQVRAQYLGEVENGNKGVKGWETLWSLMEENKKKRKKEEIDKVVSEIYKSDYFRDKTCEIIFYLLELDGETRMNKLGISRLHFNDKKYANEWKNTLMKIIHPDQCTHNKAHQATTELNKIYREMIRYAK